MPWKVVVSLPTWPPAVMVVLFENSDHFHHLPHYRRRKLISQIVPNRVQSVPVRVPVELGENDLIQVFIYSLGVGKTPLKTVFDEIPLPLKASRLRVGSKASPRVHSRHADFREANQRQITQDTVTVLQDIIAHPWPKRLGQEVIHPIGLLPQDLVETLPFDCVEQPGR